MLPSPSQSQIMQALIAFLGVVLPGVEVIAGQDNRVSEPQTPSFIVATPLRFTRLETNLDSTADCKFVGSFGPGALMVVSQLVGGSVAIGATIYGPGVAPGTTVVAQAQGAPGSVGNYTVSVAQTLAQRTLSAGQQTMTQGAEIVVQLDFHSEPITTTLPASADMAQTVSTAFRDEFATSFFSALEPPFNAVAPLYADDPRQMPFINAEQQYEARWTLDAHLQVNQTIFIPQQYTDAAIIVLKDVEALFPT